MLGAHDEAITYRKAELKTFIALGVEDKLDDDELGLLGSVLEFSEKTVSDVMVSHFSDPGQREEAEQSRHLGSTSTVYRRRRPS